MQLARAIVLFGTCLVTLAPHALGGPVTVVGTVVSDNGDGDGLADAGETLDVRLVLHNAGSVDLTGVMATLLTVGETAHLGCATQPVVSVGSLAAGETRESPAGLTVVVSPAAERVDLYETLTARFDVLIASDQIVDAGRRYGMGLALDLDLGGGGPPSSYLEDFETAIGDFGDFVEMNLDAGQYDDCADYGSAGYRCQRHSPVCNSGCDVCSNESATLGTSDPFTELFHWRVDDPASDDGGRAFSGLRSIHMGLPEVIGFNYTTPLAVLEAVGTGTPIHVGWDRVCETTRGTPCSVAADCPGPELCVAARPTLSFKHQVSLVDDRTYTWFPPGNAINRAVVQIRLLDPSGSPAGDWSTVDPYLNGYDSVATNFFTSPMFDPIDDGSLEWDLFPGTDEVGPSSTCFPNRCFTFLGDTGGPFDPLAVGRADGPALEGARGPGGWVESRISLEPFRGRSIQVRFLASFMKIGTNETWEQWAGGIDLEHKDDGWWIDDVALSDTLTAPAVAVIDANDNSGLPTASDADADGIPDACDLCPGEIANPQFDTDRDGFGNACDCDADDGAVFPGAIEFLDGVDNQCPGDVGYGEVDELSQPLRFASRTRLEWGELAGATAYQVVRSANRRFTSGCVCHTTNDTSWDGDIAPPSGLTLYYVARVVEPQQGTAGSDSNGAERAGRCLIDICAP